MTSAGIVIAVLAMITSGLTAGLFWGFGYAVMPALRRADDRTFVGVLNKINIVILNGWFAVCFGGAAVLGVLAAIVAAVTRAAALPWTIAATVIYLASLIVTFVVNVPLNNTLALIADDADPATIRTGRTDFETRWNRANVLRAAGHTVAFATAGVALLAY